MFNMSIINKNIDIKTPNIIDIVKYSYEFFSFPLPLLTANNVAPPILIKSLEL